jgi:hypothetical protein
LGLTIFLFSCRASHIVTKEEVVGEYVYKCDSGQVEVLSINGDFSFNQQLYSTFKDYRDKNIPKLTNLGMWYPCSDDPTYYSNPDEPTYYNNSICLYNFSDFILYHLENEKSNGSQVILSSQKSNWCPPSDGNDARIIIGDDQVLYRISDRALVKDNRTNP